MEQNEQAIEHLIHLVGANRTQHSFEEISAAEQELKQLALESIQQRSQSIRRAGSISALIGFVLGVWPLCLIPMVLSNFPTRPPEHEMGFAFLIAWICVGAMQSVCGFVLLIGGIRFRHRSDSGRRMILAVVHIARWYLLLFGIAWELGILIFFPNESIKYGMLLFGALVIWFWAYLLSIPKSYFSSATISQLCH